MRKTSIYLSNEDYARLSRLAEEEGVSRTDLIREAIRYYQPKCRLPRALHMDGLIDGDGTSIADVPVEELMKGFGEDSLAPWQR